MTRTARDTWEIYDEALPFAGALYGPQRVRMAAIGLGGAGLLASFLLLHSAGVGAMHLRYPAAVGCAYLAFLFLLWLIGRWLRLGRRALLCHRTPHRLRADYLKILLILSCIVSAVNGLTT